MLLKQIDSSDILFIDKPTIDNTAARQRSILTCTASLIVSAAITQGVIAAEYNTVNTVNSNQISGQLAPAISGQSVDTGLQANSASSTQLQSPSTRNSYQKISVEKATELMEVDNRTIDEAAARLKQITHNRFEADLLNIQYLATIDELHRRIAELESLLQQTRQHQNTLDSNHSNLEQSLSSITRERDDAISQLQLLNSEMQEQLGSVLSLKSESESTAGQLFERENQIAELNSRLDLLVNERDDIQAQSQALSQELSTSQEALADLQSQLSAVVLERDQIDEARAQFESELSANEAQLLEAHRRLTENQQLVDALQSQQQESEQLVQDLEGRMLSMTTERDSALEKIEFSTNERSGLANQLAALGQERDSADVELQQLQLQLSELELLREQDLTALNQERDSAANTAQELQLKLEETESLNEQQITQLTLARDGAVMAAEELQKKLTDAETLFDTRLAELSLERDEAVTNAEELQHQLSEQESAYLQQIDTVGLQRDSVANVVEQLQLQLTDTQSQHELQVAELGQERDSTITMVEQLQHQLTDAEGTVEKLTGDLSLLESKVAESDNALLSEKQIHEQTQATLLELQAETQDLHAKINTLETDNELLLNNTEQLEASRLELDSQLLTVKDDLDNRYAEVQQTLSTVTDLNSDIEQLTAERDDLAERVVGLTAQVTALETSSEQAQTDFAEKFAISEKQFLDQRTAIETELESKEQNITRMQGNLELLTDKEQASIEEINQLNAALDQSRVTHKQLESDLQKANSEIDGYKLKLNATNQTVQELTKARQQAEAETDRVATQAEELRLSLTEELNTANLGNITVQNARADNAIPIRLGNADFFETGSADLTREGEIKLTKLAKIIDSYHDRRIVVEGHTDTVPIGVGLRHRYASNWELSVARAATAVRHIHRHTSIDPRSLTASGYGEYRPIAGNETEQGRRKNRRVEVVLYQTELKFETMSVIDE